MTIETQNSDQVVKDLLQLRDDLIKRSFDDTGRATSPLAEAVYKINSCLYRGYPHPRLEGVPNK
jgi:hypothetical protein